MDRSDSDIMVHVNDIDAQHDVSAFVNLGAGDLRLQRLLLANALCCCRLVPLLLKPLLSSMSMPLSFEEYCSRCC